MSIWALFICAGLLAGSRVEAGEHSERLVKIRTEREGKTTQIYAENLQAAPVTVTLEMKLENLSPSVQLPMNATLPGGARVLLVEVTPEDPSDAWSWSYTYFATLGGMLARHDDSYAYALPYAPGKAYRVSQGFNGKYSHTGPNRYAIDWKMPEGTPVYAARDGIVVGSRDDSNTGGPDARYDGDANYVLIEHPDGTLGQYVHLLQGGNQVRVGQVVRRGDWIALSGNTGHSTGPHLHFCVFRAKNGKQRESIPVRFRSEDEKAVVLMTGRSYTAGPRRESMGYTRVGSGQTESMGAGN